MSLLRLSGIAAGYGPSLALTDVGFEVEEGKVVALMGRNGMGKSTTIKVICRMLSATGELVLDGHDLSRIPCHKAARLGLGLVPEGRRCFRGLTVAENLIVAARPGYWSIATVCGLFPRIGERLNQRAWSLSGGEQQMLAIGRALMTNPRLLLLDEATEGLAPIPRREIWSAVERMKSETGLAILLVDKSIRDLRNISDDAVVLERGRVAWSGAMSELTDSICDRHVGV